MKDESKAKGGMARARALTPSQREKIARDAANKRWGSTQPKQKPASLRVKVSISNYDFMVAYGRMFGCSVEDVAQFFIRRQICGLVEGGFQFHDTITGVVEIGIKQV